ncbi:hypothetical protein TA5114_02835 [Cognatishimia activa]|uniref:Uncharacterized protein n=1 Tax=Cognatishimia activa TaxID=1715691 RepID=A0A0N7MC24_9RHOB|nr:hypothetical protein TA5113_03167 [Cognatishimia activa]CUK27016.1 hypothetical protein TA5114_02835 [Cognatishimia activa]
MAGEASPFPDLTADCSRCAAICCVAYPFDDNDEFGLLKAADAPCPNLSNSCFDCTIHKDLDRKGFKGCVAYSCAGAGQRITQELFDGENWRDDPDLLTHMTYALRVLRPIHEALLLLKESEKLPVPKSALAKGATLTAALCPENPTSIYDFEDPEVQDALAEVPNYLQSLAAYL